MSYSHPYQLRATGFKTRTYKTEESARKAGDALALDLDRPVTLTYHAVWWDRVEQEVVHDVCTLQTFLPKHRRLDAESSRSCQHHIDTGRYLTFGETERAELFDEYNAWESARARLYEREADSDDPTSADEFYASDDAGIELLHQFAAALGRIDD